MKRKAASKPYYYMGEDPNLKFLGSLILLIDGYLAYFFDDPEPFNRYVRKGVLGSEFKNDWKEVYRILYKMAFTLKTIPALRIYVVMQGALRAFSLPLALTGTMLAISTMFFKESYPLIVTAAVILAVLGMTALVGSWVMGKKFADTINSYFMAHDKKFEVKRMLLRNVVQKLLYSFAYYLRKNGTDLTKYKFKMFNGNYKGLKVIKKPWLFRKKYIVQFDVKKLPF